MEKDRINLTDSDRKKLKVIGRISLYVDYLILVISILILLLGLYSVYDKYKVYELADSEEYAKYKPSSEDRLSYNKLRDMNPDVIGWIDVYGTKIDYPILQNKDNDYYLDRTVKGDYSTAGSIFLDYRNKKDFSDFNSIIYGHHMDERKMFGDIDKFLEKDFFEKHAYAVLHRNDMKSLGIEFFSIIKTEGTDSRIFTAALKDDLSKEVLIDYLNKNAVQKRHVELNKSDRIVLLSTCTFTITNGRYILAGKLSDKVHKNMFPGVNEKNRNAKWIEKVAGFPLLIWLVLLLLILTFIYRLCKIKYQNEERRTQNFQKKRE